MTGLSRTLPGGAVPRPRNPVATHILACWHAACIPLLVSGCLYIGPIPTVENNLPPAILRASPPSDTEEALLVGPSGLTVFVLANDPEGDEVRFTWAITGEGILGYGYPVYDGDGSEIHLEPDQELDGKTLSCLLDDDENDLVELTWLLEVL